MTHDDHDNTQQGVPAIDVYRTVMNAAALLEARAHQIATDSSCELNRFLEAVAMVFEAEAAHKLTLSLDMPLSNVDQAQAMLEALAKKQGRGGA